LRCGALRSDPVLAVLTVRTDEVGRVPAGLLRLADVRGERITLSGLTPAEVRELAVTLGCGPLSQPAAARLRDHTAGSPLHLRALMAELTAEELQAARGSLPAPHSFAMLVLSSLAGHSAHACAWVPRGVAVRSPWSGGVDVEQVQDAGL
jgi:hypothetical protein